MKSKLEQLENQHQAALQKIAETEKAILDIETRLKNKRHKAEQIAAAGEVSLYTEVKGEIADLETQLEVLHVVIDHTNKPIQREAAIEAWQQYVKESNKKLTEEYEKYLEIRTALYTQFRKILALNHEAINTRKRCAELSKTELTAFPQGKSYGNDMRADQRFFATVKLLDPLDPGGTIPTY